MECDPSVIRTYSIIFLRRRYELSSSVLRVVVRRPTELWETSRITAGTTNPSNNAVAFCRTVLRLAVVAPGLAEYLAGRVVGSVFEVPKPVAVRQMPETFGPPRPVPE